MKKNIIIVSGDPNSINSEIIFKTWKKLNKIERKRVFLISSFELIRKQFKKLKYSIKLQKVNNFKDDTKNNHLKIINIDIKFKDPFNVSKDIASNFTLKSLNLAHKLGLQKDVGGIINCAISKDLLGDKFAGVTEYLSAKCKIKNNSEVMLIRNDQFAVSPITTHIDLKSVPRKINKKIIVSKAKTLNSWFKKNNKIKPKIGILGLNPHNAELRKKSEEIKKIIPAIIRLKKLGIDVKGPLVADTVFINEFKNYDAIFGMYHDQVLPPFKTLFKFDAINTTLGLKYLRVSPDHGTAKNLIGKGKANPRSLLNCIKFVDRFGK